MRRTKFQFFLLDTNGSPILGQTIRPSNSQQQQKKKKRKKKREPADYGVKLKESEKRDKYLDLARERKTTLEHESFGDNNCNWHAGYSHKDRRSRKLED